MDIQKGKEKFKELVRAYENGVSAGYITKGDPARTNKIDGAWEVLSAIGVPYEEIVKLVDEAKRKSAAEFANR